MANAFVIWGRLNGLLAAGAAARHSQSRTPCTFAPYLYLEVFVMQTKESCFGIGTLVFFRRSLLFLSLLVLFLAVTAQAQVTFNGVQTTVVSDLNQPMGVALDMVGDVFVADTNNARIVEEPSYGGPVVVLASGLSSNPNEVTLDGGGNIYYSLGPDNGVGNGVVFEMPPEGGTPTAVPFVLRYYNGNTFSNPAGLVVDQAGDVFMADSYGGYVAKLPRVGSGWGTQEVVLDAPAAGTGDPNISPWGVGLDAAGDLYAADGYGHVLESQRSGTSYGAPTALTSSYAGQGLAVDAAGNMYTSISENQEVFEVPAGGGTPIEVPFTFNSLSTPQGVAVDGWGDVYVADSNNNDVLEVATTSVNLGIKGVGPGTLSQSLSFNLGGVTVSSIAVLNEGAAGLDFMQGSGGTCTTGTYSAATTCTVNVGFNPVAPGVRHGAVVFYDENGQQLFSLPVYGFGVAPQVAFEGAAPVGTGAGVGLGESGAVAVDGSGNLFVVVTAIQGKVVEYPRSGSGYGAGVTVANLERPAGIAVDGAGNLFVTVDTPDGSIVEIPRIPSGYGAAVTVAGNISFPYGITVDGGNNVFFTSQGNSEVDELLFSLKGYSAPVSISTSVPYPSGIAVDNRGNLVVSSLYDNSLAGGTGSVVEIRLNPNGYGQPFQVAGNLDYPFGVWMESNESVVFATESDGNQDGNTGAIYEMQNVGLIGAYGSPVALASGLSGPMGVAGDSAGDVYFTNSGSGQIMSLPRGSAPTVKFGATEVGQLSSQTQVVTLRNIGNVPLTLDAISFPASFPESASSVSTDCSTTQALTAGASCPLTIGFEPSTGGAISGGLAVTDNSLDVQNAVETIALSGNGVSPAVVSLSATSLSFGSETVGGSSNSQSVTLTNTGTAALSIASIAVTGPNASSFVFANSCGASLAAGASCSIHGHFAPTVAGVLEAAILITDDAGNSPQAIALGGTGVSPPVTLSATGLTFASTIEGEQSGSQTVTMTNTGTAALTISSITVTGTNASSFVFANSCGASLAVGANCTIHGHFAPVATGALKAAITITDSAADSPQTIALSGTGVKGPVTLSAYSLAFGSTIEGTWSASQTVIVTNTGTAALSITSIALTGADASQFAVGNTCGTSLAVGATCQIHSHFQPAAMGAMTAQVTITDSATTSPQSIALTGTGVPMPVTLSTKSLAFGSVSAGSTSASDYVTMTNTGSAVLTITSIAVTGADASSFVFANSCGTSLAVGASCSIHGHFAPAVTGALTAAVTITDSATTSPQTIALSGTGQ